MSKQVWNIDAAHSEIGFKVRHMMITNVNGVFNSYTATMLANAADFSDAEISFEADIDSVNTRNEQRDSHLKSPEFFDMEKFPKVSFKSNSFTKTGDGQYAMKGHFNMHGVEKEISMELIHTSLSIKNGIVLEDPFEGGLRKKLNFGHTIGHALEGHFVTKDPISHGYAVALGILAESFISFKKNFITLSELNEIEKVLLSNYESIDLSNENLNEIYQLMLNDKKNEQQKILCVLLIGIGESVINQEISEQEILESLEYLNRLSQEEQKEGISK